MGVTTKKGVLVKKRLRFVQTRLLWDQVLSYGTGTGTDSSLLSLRGASGTPKIIVQISEQD